VIDDWLRESLGTEPEPSVAVDPIKLDHALTVPRFHRDRPPTHILVARNGDLMRGALLDVSESSVHFESKLRKQKIPVERLARVVCVSGPSTDTARLTQGVRVHLVDGSILILDPLVVRDGKLLGRSAIYGEIAFPSRVFRH
jgi:hypothetical protein